MIIMLNSWRAGNDITQKTKIIKEGIFVDCKSSDAFNIFYP